jgi:hypothetical protein
VRGGGGGGGGEYLSTSKLFIICRIFQTIHLYFSFHYSLFLLFIHYSRFSNTNIHYSRFSIFTIFHFYYMGLLFIIPLPPSDCFDKSNWLKQPYQGIGYRLRFIWNLHAWDNRFIACFNQSACFYSVVILSNMKFWNERKIINACID